MPYPTDIPGISTTTKHSKQKHFNHSKHSQDLFHLKLKEHLKEQHSQLLNQQHLHFGISPIILRRGTPLDRSDYYPQICRIIHILSKRNGCFQELLIHLLIIKYIALIYWQPHLNSLKSSPLPIIGHNI